MKKLASFVGIGSFFATIEEYLTVVILKGDLASYLFTLFILFPAFLIVVFFSCKIIDRLVRSRPGRELAHLVGYGFVGLMIEWFLIGLSPWSNRDANPLIMLLFQIGMFCFWSSVAYAPRLFLGELPANRRVARQILGFYIPYFAVVYAIGLMVPVRLRFVTIIPLIIGGYFILNVFFVRHIWRLRTLECGDSSPLSPG